MLLDGHILWTLRADDHSKKADYALIEENLASLEKAGKCVVQKLAERFEDPLSGLEGLLYIVRRVETPTFEPQGVLSGKQMPSLLATAIKESGAEGTDAEYYDEWADKVNT